MPTVSVADVSVTYRDVEVPERCPNCGGHLAAGECSPQTVRELNLASASFYGTIEPRGGDAGFCLDPETPEEYPSDAMWIVFGYECVRCGELLATGSVDAS